MHQLAKQPAQGGEEFKKKFKKLIKINIVTCLVILFVCFLIPSEGFLNEKYNDSKAFLFSSVRDARSSCGGV